MLILRFYKWDRIKKMDQNKSHLKFTIFVDKYSQLNWRESPKRIRYETYICIRKLLLPYLEFPGQIEQNRYDLKNYRIFTTNELFYTIIIKVRNMSIYKKNMRRKSQLKNNFSNRPKKITHKNIINKVYIKTWEFKVL